jgi:hypothetical protein
MTVPLSNMVEITPERAAASKSLSSPMMFADLPPSSIVRRSDLPFTTLAEASCDWAKAGQATNDNWKTAASTIGSASGHANGGAQKLDCGDTYAYLTEHKRFRH